MAKRRGNPNWGKPMADGPIVPSRFDRLVGELGIADEPERWAGSEPLREWVSKNRHFYFVPERLLGIWRLHVNDD